MNIDAAPDWLIKAAGTPRQRHDNATAPLIDLDQAHAVIRATDYLTTAAPAVEGDGGDHHTYRTAARLKDFGISETTAYELMAEHWNERNSPPWDPEQLQQKVAHAYEYGKTPPGAADPMADFTPVDMKQPENQTADPFAAPKREALFYLKPSQIKPKLDQHALIEDYVTPQAMVVVYGNSNTGKSYLTLDMSFHIATGRPWNNKQTQQGLVIYVAAEGGPGTHNRITALKHHYGATDDFPLALVPCPVDLVKKNADTKPLIELIDQAASDFEQTPAMVVIDTLARAMAGANENASEDMSAFVSNCDRIRAASGAAVVIVHHSGKDQAKGARGHSSLRAATDTEIEVIAKGDPGSGRGVLKVTKQRDLEFERPSGFELKVLSVGTTSAGKDVTACVVLMGIAEAEVDFEEAGLTDTDKKIWQAIKDEIEVNGVDVEDASLCEKVIFGKCLPVGDCQELCRTVSRTKANSDEATRKRWERASDKLAKAGILEIYQGLVVLRY